MSVEDKQTGRTAFSLRDEPDLSETALDGVVGGATGTGASTNRKSQDGHDQHDSKSALNDEIVSLFHDTASAANLETHLSHQYRPTAQDKTVMDAIGEKQDHQAATLVDLASKLSTDQFGALINQLDHTTAKTTDGQIAKIAESIVGGGSAANNSEISSYFHSTSNAAVLQNHLNAHQMPTSENRMLHSALDDISSNNTKTLVDLASSSSGHQLDDLLNAQDRLGASSSNKDIDKAVHSIEAQSPFTSNSEVASYLHGASTAAVLQNHLNAHSTQMSSTESHTLHSALSDITDNNARTLVDLASTMSGQQLSGLLDAQDKLGASSSNGKIDDIARSIGEGTFAAGHSDVASYLHDASTAAVLQDHLAKLEHDTGHRAVTAEEKILAAALDQSAIKAGDILENLHLSKSQRFDLQNTARDLGPGASDAQIENAAKKIEGDIHPTSSSGTSDNFNGWSHITKAPDPSAPLGSTSADTDSQSRTTSGSSGQSGSASDNVDGWSRTTTTPDVSVPLDGTSTSSGQSGTTSGKVDGWSRITTMPDVSVPLDETSASSGQSGTTPGSTDGSGWNAVKTPNSLNTDI